MVLPVTMVPSGSSMAAAGAPVSSARLSAGRCDRTVGGGNARLIHQQLELAHAALVAETHADIAERLIVAADDLLAGGLAAGVVINDAVARHVDAHIGRGMIGTFAGDLLEDGGNDREDLDVCGCS